MKKITITTLILLIGIFVHSQNENQLSTFDYNNVKINGVLKTALENTHGDISLVNQLMGNNVVTSEHPGGIGEGARHFKYPDGSLIVFTDLESPEYDPYISYFDVLSISIKGVTVNVGDNINLLSGEIIFHTTPSGERRILFSHLNYDGSTISIHFDQTTNTITEILYHVWT